jgi:hypothetical protein
LIDQQIYKRRQLTKSRESRDSFVTLLPSLTATHCLLLMSGKLFHNHLPMHHFSCACPPIQPWIHGVSPVNAMYWLSISDELAHSSISWKCRARYTLRARVLSIRSTHWPPGLHQDRVRHCPGAFGTQCCAHGQRR